MRTDSHIYTLMTQPLLELGVQALFAQKEGYEFQGAYHSLPELCESLRVEQGIGSAQIVVFLDFVQDFEAHAQMLHTIRAIDGRIRCLLLLFPFIDEQTLMRALRAGADGYLLQTAAPDAIVEAVEALSTEMSYLDPNVTPKVLDELRKPAYYIEESKIQVELTQRERMLMQLTADGLNNNQIADVLGLREKTIRNLWSALFEKLGIYDRTLVVMWAIRTGYAELR